MRKQCRECLGVRFILSGKLPKVAKRAKHILIFHSHKIPKVLYGEISNRGRFNGILQDFPNTGAVVARDPAEPEVCAVARDSEPGILEQLHVKETGSESEYVQVSVIETVATDRELDREHTALEMFVPDRPSTQCFEVTRKPLYSLSERFFPMSLSKDKVDRLRV